MEDRYGDRGSGYREAWKQVGKEVLPGHVHTEARREGGPDRGWWREDGGGRVMEGREGETEESGRRKWTMRQE